MDLVFKRLNNKPESEKYLVSDYDFRKHYSGINANTAWDTVEPSVRKATQKFVIPIIGQAVYDDIATKIKDGAELTAEQTAFVEKLKDTVAYYTIYHLGPEINLLLSDTGANERGSTDGTVRPTAQWRYKDFRVDICTKADSLLDELVAMLDKYVVDGIAYFDLWKNDPLYEEQKTYFFNSAKQFGSFQNIGCSRKVFALLYQDIISVEEEIYRVICKEQFDALVAAINGSAPEDISPSYTELIRMIRRYVAARSLGAALPRLTVFIDSNGIKFSNYSDGVDSITGGESPFRGGEFIGQFALKCTVDADNFRDKLIEFVWDNIEDYPLIQDSSCFTDNTDTVGEVIAPSDGAIWL